MNYHKCTVDGLVKMSQDFSPIEPICISTEASRSLFWRGCCIVLSEDAELLNHTETDSDSRNYSPYDEARIVLSNWNEFSNLIKYVILPKRIINKIKAGRFEETTPIAYTSSPGEEIRDFYNLLGSKVISSVEAKKINKKWDGEFLNLG